VSGHVVDLVNRYPVTSSQIMTGYIQIARTATIAATPSSALQRGARQRRCGGSLRHVSPPEEHVRRLRELSRAGVDQFSLYLMSGDEEAQLSLRLQRHPALKAALDA
jgi:hypothetical protein